MESAANLSEDGYRSRQIAAARAISGIVVAKLSTTAAPE
jgi:hypothetical protein